MMLACADTMSTASNRQVQLIRERLNAKHRISLSG